jgi:hypothetical protein
VSRVIEILLKERDEAFKERDVIAKRVRDVEKALHTLGYEDGASFPKKVSPRSFGLKIRERIISTLTDKYPNGAHYAGLFEHINSNWPELPRVVKTSLSPQLTRLRDSGVTGYDVERGVWFLVKEQKND